MCAVEFAFTAAPASTNQAETEPVFGLRWYVKQVMIDGMSRIARAIMPGFAHHVTQRGNYRQEVFEDDEDRQVYLRFLCEYKKKYGLLVWAWCLMDNHIHLVCVPSAAESLGATLRDTHMRYANYFNRKRDLQGHLWQGRYASCICDERHEWAAIRYVERNPVRANMVERAEDYAWSSAAAHVTGKADGILDAGLPVEEMVQGVIGNWSEWLTSEDDEKVVRRLRSNTHTGRPCGSKGFVSKIETLLNRKLHPKKHGRPRKKAK